jgi:hypothetical protein
LPPEELIFTFKEQEKLRREKEREQNKTLKIWEKSKPTREGIRRKLTQTDVEPSALAINPKIKKKVNLAEASGFNVPVDRQKNRENRYTLIEKKREMFLVAQMLAIKDKEINKLQEHSEMRRVGLISSQQMLEQDTKSFLEFFTKVKQETNEATVELERKKKERNEMTAESRQKNDAIQTLKTQINKNNETLIAYESYMKFLLDVADRSYKDEFEREREERRRAKLESEMSQSRANSKGRSNERRPA